MVTKTVKNEGERVKANLFICGGIITHERLTFGDLVRRDKEFKVHSIETKDLLKPKFKVDSDYVVLLGLKKMERLLRKARLDRKQIMRHIWGFIDKTIPKKFPLIVVDDWSLPLLSIGNRLRKHLFANFNVKKYLLRECLITEKYPKQVVSFITPSNDHTRFMIPANQKRVDFFFQGNLSDKDRSRLFGEIRKHTKRFNCRYKIMTGGVKNVKDRLSFKEFLKVMGQAKVSLSFKGSGYDCYRYNEIPSVGSIIATPRYPWVVRNDYQDMKSCIKYDGARELKNKAKKILGSELALMDMQHQSVEWFKKYHSSEIRYKEFKEFIHGAL